MSVWAGILVGSLGCYALKLLGLSVPASVLADARVQRVAALLPVALLAALIATQTFTSEKSLVLDARAAGVAVAVVAVWRKAPFLLVIALAAATSAALHALG